MKYLLIIYLLLFLNSCDTYYYIEVVNKSNKPIEHYLAMGGEFGSSYPDSLPNSSKYVFQILPSKSYLYQSRSPWAEVFTNTKLPNDTLSVYFFSPDTLNAYPWQTIREKEKYLKRYDLSLKDLQDLNFKIVFK